MLRVAVPNKGSLSETAVEMLVEAGYVGRLVPATGKIDLIKVPGERTRPYGIVVDFLAPAHEGVRLVAESHEVSRAGRSGVYDIKVTNQHGKTVVVMRGLSHTLKGKPVAVGGAGGHGKLLGQYREHLAAGG